MQKPPNSAYFKNFGIVANRGLAYCDGKLFISQLDMKLVALRPSDGKVLGETALSSDVPNAATNYGYSETSTPVCANHRLVIGAAGSEYGIRGFIMAYTTDLKPAWPSAFWTVPPDLQVLWRRASRIVGGGAVWTPVTIDATTNTLYFGTGFADAALLPGAAARREPAHGLTDRGQPHNQQDALVAAAAGERMGLRVSQPPLVYNERQQQRDPPRRLGGNHGRRLVRVRREDRPSVPRAREGDRPRRASTAASGPAGDGLPIVASGGLDYSPAAYDPATNYVFNAAAETAPVMIQQKLTPTQKRRKFLLGGSSRACRTATSGQRCQNWHDHGSISAMTWNSGRRVWKFQTPEPERGGVTVTASGVGFAGGGDGNSSARSTLKTRQGPLDVPAPPGRSRAGPTIFSAGGKEYVAVTVGGTPTSSNGGVASWLQVFALPGRNSTRAPSSAPVETHPVTTIRASATAPRSTSAAAAAGTARIVLPGGAVPLALWQAASSNEATVNGRVFLGGKPVVGARLGVDRYASLQTTDARGGFSLRVDKTLPQRHPVRVVDASHARVGGRALTSAEQSALRAASAGISVAYRLVGLKARLQKNGTVAVSGRAVRADGAPVPGVVLLSYRLEGTVTDSSGRPVQGATVVSRTTDRDFWTFSLPSNANGHYISFFSASDEQGSDPVQLNVQVAVGQRSYSAGLANVDFKRLKSATMDLKLPASGLGLPLPKSSPNEGAVYRGLIVGALGPRGVLKPLSVLVAGRRRAVLARAAARRTRDDAPVLGDQPRDVLDPCRTARRSCESRRDAPAVDAADAQRRRRRRARLLTRSACRSYAVVDSRVEHVRRPAGRRGAHRRLSGEGAAHLHRRHDQPGCDRRQRRAVRGSGARSPADADARIARAGCPTPASPSDTSRSLACVPTWIHTAATSIQPVRRASVGRRHSCSNLRTAIKPS